MNGWYVAAGIALYVPVALVVGTVVGKYLKRRQRP